MKIVAAARTDVGRVREGNEDAVLVDDRLALYAVADGMGGHRGGEVASATAIEALRAAVAAGRSIDDAIVVANGAVLDKAEGDPALAGMGTTLTAVLAPGGSSVLLGHVGDSRAYLLRDGVLSRLTEDHSLVEELVREGRLTPEQAEIHPQRSIITRALGVEPDLEVDLAAVPVRAGDRLVLCSDGLTTMVRERDVAGVVRAEQDPVVAADSLVAAANAAGGEDNVTVVVLDVVEIDESTPPDPVALAEPAEPATPVPVPAPDVSPTAEPPPIPRAQRWRGAVLLVVPLLIVLALAAGAVGWYARRSFFVGLDGERVALFRGVPGGVLLWDPTVEQPSTLRAGDLTAADRLSLEGGAARGSRERAEAYLARLEKRTAAATSTTVPRTTAPTTRPRHATTTTRPPRTTVTTRPTSATSTAPP